MTSSQSSEACKITFILPFFHNINSFSSDYIKIGKGVLQGDCFSPLIFNMVINTFIQYIRNEFFQQFGYQFLKHFIPRHYWLRFADDLWLSQDKKVKTRLY